jgi:hypothetical protein
VIMCAWACESVLVLLQGVCISVIVVSVAIWRQCGDWRPAKKKSKKKAKSNGVTGRRGVGCESGEVVNWKRAS